MRTIFSISTGAAPRLRSALDRVPAQAARLGIVGLVVAFAVAGCGSTSPTKTPGGSGTPGQSPTATPTPGTSSTPNASPTPSSSLGPTATSGITPTPRQGLSNVGNMTTPRADATATLLLNGHVLIAGGLGATGLAVASAELYDPATGTFTATGSMTAPRNHHTAVLLHDGRVLIVGGADVTAEIYDPAPGKFTATGNMTTARTSATATLLGATAKYDVLVAGGVGAVGAPTRSTELFDPQKGTFTATGAMSVGRVGDTATLLNTGDVLIAGGGCGGCSASGYTDTLATAELYSPSTGKFRSTGSLRTPRTNATATPLADGRILIVGGSNGAKYVGQAEVYSPKTGKFGRSGTLKTPRNEQTATLYGGGRVLIVGGMGQVGKHSAVLSSIEVFNPATSKFFTAASMTTVREWQTATMLSDGRVLIAGGYDGSQVLSSAELFNP